MNHVLHTENRKQAPASSDVLDVRISNSPADEKYQENIAVQMVVQTDPYIVLDG
jgi:hypothetical protein